MSARRVASKTTGADHAYAAPPRHEMVFLPEFAELRLCGHVSEDEDGIERICVLRADEHEPEPTFADPAPGGLRSKTTRHEEQRAALENIARLTEPNHDGPVDGELIHALALRGLGRATP